MRSSHSPAPGASQIVRVPISDRWQIQRRLQELSVTAHCSQDGSLTVEVNTHVEATQTWSVVRQFCAPRSELVRWLEKCWHQRPSQPTVDL